MQQSYQTHLSHRGSPFRCRLQLRPPQRAPLSTQAYPFTSLLLFLSRTRQNNNNQFLLYPVLQLTCQQQHSARKLPSLAGCDHREAVQQRGVCPGDTRPETVRTQRRSRGNDDVDRGLPGLYRKPQCFFVIFVCLFWCFFNVGVS